MRRSRLIVVGSGLVFVLAVIGVILVSGLLQNKVAPGANPLFEKGGQLTAAGQVKPAISGPVEPTLPPSTSPAPVVAATPPATATVRPQSISIIPKKIKIPALQIDTFVEQVGVTSAGTMDTPKNIWNTAWFAEGGYRPGQKGNAVIAGHLDAPGTKAIFWDLDKLKPGDKVSVSDAAGRELTFEVTNREIYPVEDAPLQTIFGPAAEPQLNLITCGGTFDRTSQSYNKRLVVYTQLIK
jgi:LPXTG-site transpeptidase (sortase) family protein